MRMIQWNSAEEVLMLIRKVRVHPELRVQVIPG